MTTLTLAYNGFITYDNLDISLQQVLTTLTLAYNGSW